MRAFIVLIALPFLLLACKKGAGNFTVEGTISDDSFQGPLVGAQVKIYSLTTTNQANLVGSATTDVNGHYTITFPRERIAEYTLTAEKEDYFNLNEVLYYSQLDLNQPNQKNYSMAAKSWVEIKLVNSNPQPSDHLQFIRQQGKANCTECCSDLMQHFYGAQNTSVFCINDGNKPYSIEYAVFGTSNSGVLQVTTTPFDTTLLLLNY